ncbi:hypothetical protein B0A49_09577 [Cryomyces minteri]|uniref:Geranylgeranyl transferase type-2 subunit alpha n=2 Tax=Cryomyces minteri TaxID=331657 RepID=A0A4U0WG24_9PEZI|nr:hypothetical protein B0A49_09577 [Cryomyces minteri]
MASHGVLRVSEVSKSEQTQQKELRQIEQYRELVDLWQITEQQYTVEVLALTSKLLNKNPEYYTIWNHRRRVLQHLLSPPSGTSSSPPGPVSSSPTPRTTHDLIADDLRFLIPLLRLYPKCYWMWNHRLWLLQQSTDLLPRSAARRLWQEELGLVGRMLTLDSRNFHGWGYRRVVVSALESQTLASTLQSDSTPQNGEEATAQGEQEAGAVSMVEQEFVYTTRMISTNLSNFSAWHNRSKIIPRLLYERCVSSIMRRQLLDDEFELVRRGLWTDPYDQSLWFYHDYLMSIMSPSVPAEAAIVLDLTDEDRRERLRGERDSVEEMLEGAEDCKWIYQALLQCTAQYLGLAVKVKNGDIKHNAPDPEVKNNMRVWLEQLKTLDPLRMGRWDDLHNALQL